MTGGTPLTSEQRQELSDANERARKVLRAANVAAFNGWTIGIFAAVGILFGIVSITALVMGVGMALVARNEFRGRNLLRQFDSLGPRFLGRNQLGFMALIIAYCLWSMYQAVSNPITEIQGLETIADAYGSLVTELTLVVYGGVIALTVLFQGLNARYYFTRTQHVEEYRRETPGWIVEIQRSTSAL
jgi:hypothetical protein